MAVYGRAGPRCAPAAIALLAVLTAAGLGVAGAPAAAREAVRVTLLSYNIQGLPQMIAGSGREKAMPAIARRSCRFSVALFQEDFAYHDLLRRNSDCHAHIARPPGEPGTTGGALMGLRTSNLSKLLGSGKLFGSGLAVFTRYEATRNKRLRYRVCEGYLGNKQDCFSDKGAQLVTLRLGRGLALDVYNTHLDAGQAPADKAARVRQLDELAGFVERFSHDRPVVVAGDFNMNWRNREARLVLERFMGRLGLVRVARAEDPKRPIDHILFRGSARIAVTVRRAGIAKGFAARGHALSDHRPVTATFIVSVRPGRG